MGRTNKVRLSDRFAKAVDGAAGKARYWDTTTTGFFLSVSRAGVKSWAVLFRVNGVRREMSLGKVGAVDCDDARALAKRILADAEGGKDALAERERVRSTLTLGEFWKGHYEPDARGRWKASTAASNRRNWEKLIEPALGGKRIDAISTLDVAQWHRRQSGAPIQANIALRQLKAIFNHAVRLEVLKVSPAARVKANRENRRERFLSPEEFACIWQAIAAEEAEGCAPSQPRIDPTPELLARIDAQRAALGKPPLRRRRDGSVDRRELAESTTRGISAHAAALFRLLILTGCRLREIMCARWEWVRLDTRVLALPDTKTGARLVPLADAAVVELEKLRALRTHGSPWLIEGREPAKAFTSPAKPWQRVLERATEVLKARRRAAGHEPLVRPFDGVRIHDLRHSFASVGVAQHLGLPIVGKALGHAQARTTERYAHLADDPVRGAVNVIADAIMEAVENPGAVVEPVRKTSAS